MTQARPLPTDTIRRLRPLLERLERDEDDRDNLVTLGAIRSLLRGAGRTMIDLAGAVGAVPQSAPVRRPASPTRAPEAAGRGEAAAPEPPGHIKGGGELGMMCNQLMAAGVFERLSGREQQLVAMIARAIGAAGPVTLQNRTRLSEIYTTHVQGRRARHG